VKATRVPNGSGAGVFVTVGADGGTGASVWAGEAGTAVEAGTGVRVGAGEGAAGEAESRARSARSAARRMVGHPIL